MSQVIVTVRYKQSAEDLEIPSTLDLDEVNQILSQGLDWNLPDFWALFDVDRNLELEESLSAAGVLDGMILEIRETGRRSKRSPVLGWRKMAQATPPADSGAPPENDGFAWKEV
ncbi:hypothetical protein JST97_20190 [bacterium]|nr:hypothetical protein [bacterium]